MLTVEPVPGRAHVSAVFTHPDRWREGIAAGLLELAEDAMRAEGYPEVQLWTPREAPARRFYEADGLAARRPRAVARRDRAADRRVRQAAVRIYLGAFGDPGHAFPMLALGEALVARGHAVALQTWRRWEEHATAAGMTFAAAPEYQVFPTRERPLKPYEAAVRAARETVPSVAAFAPDLAVADILTPAPALAAELCGVPVATRRPARLPVAAPGFPPFAIGARRPRTPLGRRAWRGSTRSSRRGWRGPRRVQRLPRAARAAAARPAPHRRSRALLTLVATLPQLEYPRDWAPWLRVTGPLLWEPPGERVDAAAGRRAGGPGRPLDRTGSRSTRCCAPRSPGSRARPSA